MSMAKVSAWSKQNPSAFRFKTFKGNRPVMRMDWQQDRPCLPGPFPFHTNPPAKSRDHQLDGASGTLKELVAFFS